MFVATSGISMMICIFFVIQSNVGDSRAVASVSGVCQVLSEDHKPSNENESKRIIAAGGWVEFNRVNGKMLHTIRKLYANNK